MQFRKRPNSILSNIEVVILCGGKGTRMGESTKFIPKPMIKIGRKPILWHIMKIYSYWGFNNFILCLGYKGNKIKEYFRDSKKWNISFVDTGLYTNTGGRIKKIEKYIKGKTFFATYGDGLSDVNLYKLFKYHKEKNRVATLTAVKPLSQFGIMELRADGLVTKFKEKPTLDYWVNGGFFVFEKDIFSSLGENDVLEKEPFIKLIKKNNIAAYKHKGFWECMDTYKDNLELNNMWKTRKARWAIWRR